MCYVLRDKSGFTLFEIMVTISLVVLLLTLSSVVYRNTNKRTELVFTAHQVGAMARLAESYAASAKEFDSTTLGQNVWGMYFDKSAIGAKNKKVIMFVDKDNDQLYDTGEEIRVLELPNKIYIFNIFKPGVSTEWDNINQATVLFSPPDPKTKLCDVSSGTCQLANIVKILRVVFKDEFNESVKEVKFNFFGLIDVR